MNSVLDIRSHRLPGGVFSFQRLGCLPGGSFSPSKRVPPPSKEIFFKENKVSSSLPYFLFQGFPLVGAFDSVLGDFSSFLWGEWDISSSVGGVRGVKATKYLQYSHIVNIQWVAIVCRSSIK